MTDADAVADAGAGEEPLRCVDGSEEEPERSTGASFEVLWRGSVVAVEAAVSVALLVVVVVKVVVKEEEGAATPMSGREGVREEDGEVRREDEGLRWEEGEEGDEEQEASLAMTEGKADVKGVDDAVE